MFYIYLAVYNLLLALSVVVSLPFIWRKVKPDRKFPGDWKERISVYDRKTLERLKKQKNIWLHTVSIGEFLSVTPLIEKLQRQKNENILVTLATKTGRRVAETKVPGIQHLFFPIDFYPVMKRAIKKINPKLIVIIETELWPSLLKIASDKKIPVLLLNGRISPFSFSKYRKIRFFSKRLLPLFSAITMRTQEEAERLIYLGADKNAIKIVGSMKFDLAYEMSKTVNPAQVREKLGIDENRRVVVFGSLHPAEEKPVADIAEKILKRFSDVTVVIVPRYLDKTDIYRTLQKIKIEYVKRSDMPQNKQYPVIVVNTYGELNSFYSICEFAFVGASLYRWGGQNPIEPTAFRKPVIFGIHNWHFKEEWEKIKEGGGGIEVHNYERLNYEVSRLLQNPDICRKIGERAYEVLLANTGATERNLSLLRGQLLTLDIKT
jgi:3-deoxy-D-manno-octulosonic-acid transferase